MSADQNLAGAPRGHFATTVQKVALDNRSKIKKQDIRLIILIAQKIN